VIQTISTRLRRRYLVTVGLDQAKQGNTPGKIKTIASVCIGSFHWRYEKLWMDAIVKFQFQSHFRGHQINFMLLLLSLK